MRIGAVYRFRGRAVVVVAARPRGGWYAIGVASGRLARVTARALRRE